MQKIKLIIFDFDGTIADTLSLSIEIVNSLSSIYNYAKITDENISYLRTKSAQEIVKLSGIPFYKVPSVAIKFHKEFQVRAGDLKLFDGLRQVLEILSHNYELGILTSNSKSNVSNFLEKNNVSTFFSFIVCNQGLFGKSSLLKKIIKKKELTNDEVIYVGDETRDIEAAHKSKIKSVAVSWGFNARDLLEKYKADVIVDTPAELQKLFTSK